MQKSNRILKVSTTTRASFPKINIQGKWLLDLGFEIGSYVEVTSKANQVIITKIDEPKQPPTANYKTILPKTTIDLVKEQAKQYHIQEQDIIVKALLTYFKKKERKHVTNVKITTKYDD